MTRRVLVVEDDAPVREALAQTLELAEFVPETAGSFVVAKDHITAEFDGVILSDMRMPGRDGFHLLDYARGQDPDLPVILLTGEGDIPMAVRAMTEGAFAFLEKPCAPRELLAVLERALKVRAMALENRKLKAHSAKGDVAARMIFGVSELADRLRQRARDAAGVAADVLVAGYPGAGTANVAEVIHRLSGAGSFVKRAAADLSAAELLSVATEAGGGTLFLDEVAALPPESQLALLEWLERPRDVRLVAGTYRDLGEEAAAGRLSHDLRLRLETVIVRIPPLRDRPEDIPVIFRQYVARVCEEAGRRPMDVGEDRIAALLARDWPGNSRELMNAATRFVLELDGEEDSEDQGLAARMARVERVFLADALRAEGGQASAAAKRLQLPRKTFYDKLARHGLKPEDFR